MKKRFALFSVVALIGLFLLSNCAKDDDSNKTKSSSNVADLVVYGKIYTAEGDNDSLAEAFAVKDGKFVYVGTKSEAEKYVGEGTKVVYSTDNELVIPGCTEGHGHFIGIDGVARKLPGYLASYNELISVVIPQHMQRNPGQFLSFGWESGSVKREGTADYAMEIEAVSDGYPAILLDASGHSALCNRTALRSAGLINDNGEVIKNIRGGEIITKLDGSGNPTNIANGYISDEVIPYVIKETMGELLDDVSYRQACQNAVAELNKRGFTSYLDAYVNVFDDAMMYKHLSDIDKAGQLTVNVMGYYTIHAYDWEGSKGGAMPQKIHNKIEHIKGFVSKYTTQHLNVSGVKLFADGVVESATGWISQKYLIDGLPESKAHGNKIWEQEELNAIVAAANAEGLPVHTHTFGDLACNAVINAYCASPSAQDLKVRNSLAHVRNIAANDISRCGQNNIGIASNLIWHVGDPDDYRNYFYSIMPISVYENGYPMKSLLNAGIVVSSSTDAPCGEIIIGNVPNIIGVSVIGLSPSYLNVLPLGPSELLTVSEALRCLTINGASSLGIDAERGSIKVGKYADFVVLDQDVLDLEAQGRRTDIFNTNVKSTWFEGKKVYGVQ